MCVSCSNRNKKVQRDNKTSCMNRYNELINLDLQVTSLYLKNKDSRLLSLNKQLREWISKLQHSCPPEDDFEDIKYILKNEYSISI